jgi:acetyl-CoA synthetase
MSNHLESTLEETRQFAPPVEFTKNANIDEHNFKALHQAAEADYEGFWQRLAEQYIDWKQPFTKTLNAEKAPHFSWFEDGQMNASYNCIDRHLEENAEHTAIIFENEQGDIKKYTYKNVHDEVCRLANALNLNNIKTGDRVILYMPMVPQAVFAMQACARIGATHSVVFGGFSAEALKDRIEDCKAKMVITADGSMRGGKLVELKAIVDKALENSEHNVPTVLVLKNANNEVKMQENRDKWWNEEVAGMSNYFSPIAVPSEHPLFILYTSGSTGKPKGIQHSTAGYLLHATLTMKWVMDFKPETDLFWCTADVGWITGHSYVCYGPLSCGGTIMMYEGGPVTPDAGRFWQICETHKVSIFYTAPTAIRALMKAGDQFPNKYDLSSIRLLGTVGEPINPEAWMWYHHTIGKEKIPIIDTWWQTETGASMIAPIPGVINAKPGSCTKPLPGITAMVVDEQGTPITEPNRGGHLVIEKPWPSMLRTVWGNDQRYLDTYWAQFDNRYYVTGDNARIDEDGFVWIMGRSDDVLNVSGHRLGTMEIESAIVAHQSVAEAAIIGTPHDVKGEAILAFVICIDECPKGKKAEQRAKELRQQVTKSIGAIAKPDEIRFVDSLPKTRSGKIMRRLLRTIGKGEKVTQDTSTLENPGIIEKLQTQGH